MSSLALLQVKQLSSSELSFAWNDGHQSLIAMRTLRDACPCAGCKGETVLFRTYAPPGVDVNTSGRYELKGIDQIGGYALKFLWADGHDMGLYTWEHLRDLCECDACLTSGRNRRQIS
jgi:DUF971 family protein